MDVFEPIWKRKKEIEDAYRIVFRAAVQSTKGIVFKSVSEEIKARQEAMGDYRTRVYGPAQKQLREECTKLGHKEGNYDRDYHDSGFGWAGLSCHYCGIELKKWLDGIELKVENGEAVNDGKNWIKVDGSKGPSCVDEDEE